MKKMISFLILSVISLQIYAVSISDMKYRFRNRKGYSTVKTTFVLNDWDYKTEILKIETGVGVDISINMNDAEHTKINKRAIKYFVKDKATKARRLFKYNLKTHKALLIIKDKNELPGDPSKLWVSTTNINSSSAKFDDDDDVPDEINIDYQRVTMKEFYVVEDATAHTNYLPHFEAATRYNSYPYHVPQVEHVLPQSELFELIDTEYYETSTKFVMKFTINVHTDLFDPNAKNFWLGIELPSGGNANFTIISFQYLNDVVIPAGGKYSTYTILRNDNEILSFIIKSTQNWKVIYNKITKQLVVYIKGKFNAQGGHLIYSTKDMNHFRLYLVYNVDETTGSDDNATVYAIYPRIAYKDSVGNGSIEE